MHPLRTSQKDTKDLKTRVELVACFQLAVDDARAASKGIFYNTMNQIHVLNPCVEHNTSGMGVNYYVADGQILVPDYLRISSINQLGILLDCRLLLKEKRRGDHSFVSACVPFFVIFVVSRTIACLCNVHTILAQVVTLFIFRPLVVLL